MLTFCTLFDSNYLDKGLVLYDSMKAVMENFRLYILAMDEPCCQILKSMELPNVVVISLQEFEDEELRQIKQQRSRAEYCWTCTASLIGYVLEQYAEAFCTYVDADLYFFKDPKPLIEEMIAAQKSVQIVEHGFGTGRRARIQEKNSGRFCVEFNTFRNDDSGWEVLSEWREQTRAHCSMQINEMGDQKYLTDWPEKYSQVHVLTHQGGGVAPWNIARFAVSEKTPGSITEKRTGREYELVFYHFHHLEYRDDGYVDINVFKSGLGAEKQLVENIYFPYLKALEEKKQMLGKNFGMRPVIKSHPGFVTQSRAEKMRMLRSMSPGGLYHKVVEKIIYLQGKKKDLVCLDEIV